MKNLVWPGLIFLVFVASWLVGGLLQNRDDTHYQMMSIPPCDPATIKCTAFFSDATLAIKFTAPVRVMKPFTVSVETDAALSNLHLMFQMKNMDMGMQRYALEQNKHGQWQADVVLPVCSLGRSDWTLTLETEYKNSVWRGDLDFSAVRLTN